MNLFSRIVRIIRKGSFTLTLSDMKKTVTHLFYGFFLASIFSLILSLNAKAQFTLNESDFSALIGTGFDVELISFSQSGSLIPIIDQSGEDQTWDLSSFAVQDSVYGSGNIEFFNSFAGKPGAGDDHFSDANVMAQSEFEVTFSINGSDSTINQIIYSYNELTDSGLFEYGNVQAEASAPETPLLTIKNTPSETVYPFPLTYGTTWNYSYTSETIQSVGGQSSSDYTVSGEVDGWGEVVIGNTTIPVLRIRSEETTEFSGFEFTSVTIIFVDENGFEFASLSADLIPFSNDYDPDTANLQITAYDQINIVSAETSPDLPQSVSLNQNFPNPFNPTTQISYQLNRSAEVSLTVYSLTGQRVQTLLSSEMKQAGEHIVPFNAGNLASGVYMYRLRAGDQIFTRKMTLLK